MPTKNEENLKARVRNFPYHREKITKTTNGSKKTIQTFMHGDEVVVTREEFAANEHLLETEEQYQARVNNHGNTKSKN